MNERLIFFIKEFCVLQVRLSKELMKEFDQFSDWELLLGFPKNGRLKLIDGEWLFRKHGTGVEFTNKKNSKVVDICNNITQPNLFDSWRLETYLESIGEPEVDNLEEELATLNRAGIIEKHNGTVKTYKLSFNVCS